MPHTESPSRKLINWHEQEIGHEMRIILKHIKTNTMLYDYKLHIEKMKTSNARETLEEYATHYGPQENMDIYDTFFYKEHLAKYDIPFTLLTPRRLKNSYNWDLFVRLMAASQCSEIIISLDKEWTREPTGIPLAHIGLLLGRGCDVAHDIKDLNASIITWLHEFFVEELMINFSLIALKREFYGDVSVGDSMEYGYEGPSYEEDQNLQLMKYNERTSILMREADNVRKLHEILT